MKTVLTYFRANGKNYYHSIDTKTDATYVTDDKDEPRYTVDSDANVSDRAGRIGKFRTDDHGCWNFIGLSGVVIEGRTKELIEAELKIFKLFLEK